MKAVATLMLDRALDYTYRQAQERSLTANEHEDVAISLKLIGLLRDGSSGAGVFNLACGMAVGLPHTKYLYRRAERAAFMRRELMSAIPDYDASTEKIPDYDPTDGRRHHYFGNKFRHLAAQASARDESGATRSADNPQGIQSRAQQKVFARARAIKRETYFGA
jgi:hypothetical protein